jgi:hypothetical protein
VHDEIEFRFGEGRDRLLMIAGLTEVEQEQIKID